MCVARATDTPLLVVLEVIPVRLPDGEAPTAIFLDPFVVQGPVQRTLALPRPVSVRGKVRDGEVVVAADVSFLPLNALPGVANRAITTSTGGGQSGAGLESDYEVRLLAGVEYTLRVTPADTRLPPHERMLRFAGHGDVEVDYGRIDLHEVTFEIHGVPEGRPLIVRAFDPASGRVVSSTARLSGASSSEEAVLTFAEHEGSYRLVVQPEESYAMVEADSATGCDVETPLMPVLSIPSEDLGSTEDGVIALTLPEPAGRVRYEGAIELCESPQAERNAPDTLPVVLRSRATQESEDGTEWSTELSADTQARLDLETGRYRFCLELMPGDYDVVVTPPSTVGCALFAEQRLISAPDEGIATPGLLEIPSSAFLVGTLQTQAAEPLPDAIVDAQSLGRETGIELPADARSVTRYSRSMQTLTGSDGQFRLPVDLGLYDVTIKPPATSGFSWQVRHDVVIGPRSLDFATVIDMASPVVLEGSLEYTGLDDEAQASLAQAEVIAHAILEGAQGEQRAVPVGRTSADGKGRFTLLLPPALHTGW